jgi:hypothetical protein
VIIHTDLMLSGAVAQYGRGVGMIQSTAAQIIGQFAGNLRSQLGQPAASARVVPPPASPPMINDAPPVVPIPQAAPRGSPALPPAAKPISGLSLMTRVIWQQVVALFSRRSKP